MAEVLTLILAGGKGTRLEPLTRDRAKPAVPFGGQYRIIDFTLSNCINSNLRRVLVLTQYKARSLDRHIAAGWSFLSRQLGEYIDVLPPQQRIDQHWYKGTADAIYQNIYSIEKADPDYVLILAGDHIYKMDYGDMIRAHIQRGGRFDDRLYSGAVARWLGPGYFATGCRREGGRPDGETAPAAEPARHARDVPGFHGHLCLHGPAHVRVAVPGRHPPGQWP